MTQQHDRADHSLFQWFVHSESAGSVILLICAVTALIWANSAWADSYFELEHKRVAVYWGEKPLGPFDMSLGHWVGDGLMAIFFFVVGLEIKREMVVGQLSSIEQAVLPVSAAIGGMIMPALIFAGLNATGDGSAGWGIPMATDIAFALGILSLFGKRVPIELKVFLTALAIADDMGAVVVIALFYTKSISWAALLIAAGLLALMAVLGRVGVRATWIYLALAIAVWGAVFASGLHSTVAGVLIALLVPVKSAISPDKFLQQSQQRLQELEQTNLTLTSVFRKPHQVEALDDLYLTVQEMRPAGLTLEHALHPIQALLILPLFAFFKAGVPISAETGGLLASSVSLGIILGLVVGKPLGIMLSCWIAVCFFGARLPAGVNWQQIFGVSCLAGIGFTMSMFVSELAFPDHKELISQAKIGVLIASVASAVTGSIVLSRAFPRR